MGFLQSVGRLLWWMLATAVEIAFTPQITERTSVWGELLAGRWW